MNPKNSRDSYVSNLDSTLSDYHVTSVADRNGALDGDEVLLKLKSQTELPEGKPTAVVVFIVDKVCVHFKWFRRILLIFCLDSSAYISRESKAPP